ncbi:lytic transglycosylase domain-containing protein [Antarcticirhabdus aurantiaca]|uniref:Transglycosylase SLT domain-containing protein n=1 Tax=Antarcticirhabdus aurantiaca TaxID=2606717 RepID=A0ACD4NJP3_9HYPH|nr:transglycosylase SLT domain-containing protein [Antarcticirhabdus aurantiaca]WAJ27000.1 transglycosylase SLT domain-containing protein [Jeongeuplla avenae]
MPVPSLARSRAAARSIGTMLAIVVGAGALSGCLAQGATEYDAAQNGALGRSTGAIPVPALAPRAAEGKGSRLARAETAPKDKVQSGKDRDALLTEVAYAPSRERVAEAFAQAETRGSTISGSTAIDALIEKHARENGIPPALAYGFVRVESRYNPSAKGSGVYGLSQIKPSTARGLGFSGPTTALFDPDTNLRYGMRYLAGAWQKGGGDVCMAAMKYKGGHRATRMTKSTLSYCAAVKREMAKVSGRSRMPETVIAAALKEKPETAAAVALTQTAAPKTTASAAIAAASQTPEARAVALTAGETKAAAASEAIAAAAVAVPAARPAASDAAREIASAAPVSAKSGRIGHHAAGDVPVPSFAD